MQVSLAHRRPIGGSRHAGTSAPEPYALVERVSLVDCMGRHAIAAT
jgi:hypothetical protein